jgi:phosphoenolpyruvate carboxykinase (ATP)
MFGGARSISRSHPRALLSTASARDYLNICDRIYFVDGFAGWDLKYRIMVRVICSRPYHALFMHTMLIRPTKEELVEFGKPDFVIYNSGGRR